MPEFLYHDRLPCLLTDMSLDCIGVFTVGGDGIIAVQMKHIPTCQHFEIAIVIEGENIIETNKENPASPSLSESEAVGCTYAPRNLYFLIC